MFFCFMAIALSFSSCNKDKGSNGNSNIDRQLGNNIDDIFFIKECIKDWDCDKGIMYSQDGDSQSNTYYCDEFKDATSDAIFAGMGNFQYGSYNYGKKTVTLQFEYKWLDYGAWAYRWGNRTVSFYTKKQH